MKAFKRPKPNAGLVIYILYIFSERTAQNLVNQSKRKLKVEFLNAVRRNSSNWGIVVMKQAFWSDLRRGTSFIYLAKWMFLHSNVLRGKGSGI